MTVVSLLGDRSRLKRTKHVLTAWGPGWSGETGHFQDGCAFPSFPAELWTLSPDSPAFPLCSGPEGAVIAGRGQGRVHPWGPGTSPTRTLDLSARCEAVPSACFARGLSQGSARLTTRPEIGEKALGFRRSPCKYQEKHSFSFYQGCSTALQGDT